MVKPTSQDVKSLRQLLPRRPVGPSEETENSVIQHVHLLSGRAPWEARYGITLWLVFWYEAEPPAPQTQQGVWGT